MVILLHDTCPTVWLALCQAEARTGDVVHHHMHLLQFRDKESNVGVPYLAQPGCFDSDRDRPTLEVQPIVSLAG